MKETITKVALAGLMHDVGKFAQGVLDVSQKYMVDNAGLYQPFRNGHHTHVHVIYTAAFIEQHAESLPPQCNSADWGDGDSFVNLAAGHHNPQTAMQWIIAEADRISSGLDRASFEKGEEIAFRDFKKTRLLPVLEGLGPERIDDFNSADAYTYRYPLLPVSARNIFPEKRVELSRKDADEDYAHLFSRFTSALKQLEHKDESVSLWLEHFDSLLMLFTSCIPAARVGDVIHDVSLYDHSRSTAALAAALYGFHAGNGTLEPKAVRDRNPKKFLIVGGDFYGIQDFIFANHGDSRKLRSKLLRGRSFAVSLFTELAARLICQRLGLPVTSVLLSAAGKFHILAPNLPEMVDRLKSCDTEINDWLFEHTYGENALGISWTEAAPEEFEAGRFRALWDRHIRNIEDKKYRKLDLDSHGGTIDGYLDSFDNDIDPGNRLCPLCGKRASHRSTTGDPVFAGDDLSTCRFCRDHVYLGGNLVKASRVAVTSAQVDVPARRRLLEPIFKEYQVIFDLADHRSMAAAGDLKALWQIGIEEDGTIRPGCTVKLINGHVPWYQEEDNYDDCLLESARSQGKLDEMIEQIKEGSVKTFGHIAVKARAKGEDGKCHGIEALGVLKADVDNLGMLFGCGLSDERFTISRLATMSRQLNNFFALYLSHELRANRDFFDVYTVFAGGDDLFLIGPWNRMAKLAALLNRKFRKYVCENPEITFSAGITVHKPNVPVDTLADSSETALEEAKKAGRNRVTMFGQTVKWNDFHSLLALEGEFEKWRQEGYISDVMIYKMNYFIEMAEKEAMLLEQDFIPVEELESLKWPALFKYNLVRNVTKDKGKRDKAIEDVAKAADWMRQYKGGVRIPLWHVLYEKRN